MSQAKAFHGFPDFDHQACFDLELFSISQAKVGKHVAGTTMHFNAVNKSSFHFRNSFTHASAIFSLTRMMSMSSFGVAMPRLLFFWKQ